MGAYWKKYGQVSGNKFSSGEVDLDSSTNTKITCGFQPKTITYDTMNGTYRMNVFYDQELGFYNGVQQQLMLYTTNNSATKCNIGDTSGARIISIDADGFTVGKGGGTYGTKCKYKCYG